MEILDSCRRIRNRINIFGVSSSLCSLVVYEPSLNSFFAKIWWKTMAANLFDAGCGLSSKEGINGLLTEC